MTDRLQQLADTLCRRFCGRKLRWDKRALTKLGSGKLEVDLLKKTCRFERHYVSKLIIVDELRRQLRLYLNEHGVAQETIRSVTLSVKLTINERADQKDNSVMWFGEHDGFVGCAMDIQCLVRTENESCKSEHRGYVEWPRECGRDPHP